MLLNQEAQANTLCEKATEDIINLSRKIHVVIVSTFQTFFKNTCGHCLNDIGVVIQDFLKQLRERTLIIIRFGTWKGCQPLNIAAKPCDDIAETLRLCKAKRQ